MEDAGQKLRRVRERLKLTYRDVEDASKIIAQRHNSDEFNVVVSRLFVIENTGTLPTIYRLYSLCAIYRLDIHEVLAWYGVDVGQLPGDAAAVRLEHSHLINFSANGIGEAQIPLSLDPGIDLKKTTYLSRMIQRWGKLPLSLLSSLDLKNHRYAYIGSEDWSMYPLIQPGALVLLDEARRKIANSGWTNEFDRPIYFLEHRQGYACGWCTLKDDQLVVQPHPASRCSASVYSYGDIDVIGQVVGVAMLLNQGTRRRVRA